MYCLPASTVMGLLETVRLEEAGCPNTCMMGSDTGQPAGQAAKFRPVEAGHSEEREEIT